MIINPYSFDSASPLLTNLVSYWKLDEASGNATDSHGANTGVDNNTVTSAAGKVGTARQLFSGNLEYFSIADNPDVSLGDIDCTIAFWVRFDDLSAAQDVISKDDEGSNREYLIGFNGTTRLRFGVFDAATGTNFVQVVADSLGMPVIDTWYLVIVWHDSIADTLNIQVNDGTVDSVSTSAGIRNAAADFNIGRRSSNNNYLNARVDEAGIWKRVWTAGERTQFYNSGNGVTYPGFV